MTPQALAKVVARLYTAAGRNYGKVELEVWADALDDITDEEGEHVARGLVRNVDMASRIATPAVVRDAVMKLRGERRDAVPALEPVTGPLLPVEENLRRIDEARKLIIKPVDEAIA
jgi:hypothetical protein